MNWYANIRNRVNPSEKRKENREKREQEALNSVIFGTGTQSSQYRGTRDGRGDVEERTAFQPRVPVASAHSLSSSVAEGERTESRSDRSSDLMMLSKIKPAPRTKRKIGEPSSSSSSSSSSLTKGVTKERKKRYEAAFVPNASTSLKKRQAAARSGGTEWPQSMQMDPIDHLDLSPSTTDNANESKTQSGDILFFNDGMRVDETGVPIDVQASSTMMFSEQDEQISHQAHIGVVMHDHSSLQQKQSQTLKLSELFDGDLSAFLR